MEQEEIHGAHSVGVYEIVPSVSCRNESTSPSQMRCTDILHRLINEFYTDELHGCLVQDSLWTQQARCLSES